MLLTNFIDKYGDQGDDKTIDNVVRISMSIFGKFRVYRNCDAVILVFDKCDYVQAYLIFHRFSKRVVSLFNEMSIAENCNVVTTTRDVKIVRLLTRIGFVVLDTQREMSSEATMIRTPNV